MSRLFHISVLLAGSLLLWPCVAGAQSEDVPLGDLARTLRKNQSPPRAIIDNDNLSDVMEQGENKRWASSGPRSSLNNAAMQVVNAASPDVTCALSFSGQKDPLAENFQPQNLPESEVTKLDGPATIVGDSLQLSIHNGSSWDLREITVGVTLVHRQSELSTQFDGFRLIPAAMNDPVTIEKRSDVTVLYHLKGTAAPASTTLFQAPLNLTIGPDQEWHWAIVQAKGVSPAAPPELPESRLPLIQAPN
jgi:hypothetical protein